MLNSILDTVNSLLPGKGKQTQCRDGPVLMPSAVRTVGSRKTLEAEAALLPTLQVALVIVVLTAITPPTTHQDAT